MLAIVRVWYREGSVQCYQHVFQNWKVSEDLQWVVVSSMEVTIGLFCGQAVVTVFIDEEM